MITLSDYIKPEIMIARSVNIERDRGDIKTLQQYRLTGKGLDIIQRLTAALNGERISAWSLTGPYGMGKSSFTNYLLALCGPPHDKETKVARDMLKEKDLELAHKFQRIMSDRSPISKGLLRVPATSSFESINSTLAKGLYRALIANTPSQASLVSAVQDLRQEARDLAAQTTPETLRLVELFKAATKVYSAPVAIVIDEFGKNLEFMARFPAQGDLFVLQALAESEHIYLWVCLHQAFDEYTSRLSARQLQEWGKIQGRFEDISFIEPKSQMLRFICEALKRKNPDQKLSQATRRWAEHFHETIRALNLTDFKDFDPDLIELFYPLHPLAALVLPELCVRFAQNDRTLFAFLCSGEPNALPAFLSTQSIDPDAEQLATFGVELLYDYFLASSTSALMNRPESQRWIEIHDIIERSRNLDLFHLNVLKAIGLLNLISGPSGFRASSKLLSFAFFQSGSESEASKEAIQTAIDENVSKGVLVYREYADEYRLWEGSDFDIIAAIRERKALLSTQSLEENLQSTLPLPPLTASRHSYETGTLRHFERRWCDLSQMGSELPRCSTDEIDGLLLYCFGNEQDPPTFPTATRDGRPLIIAYAACEEQIRDMVLNAAAIKAVLRDAPELERDGVARKEARFRASASEQQLRDHLTELFSPGNPEVRWFVADKKEELTSNAELSRLLSRCCDRTYGKCPKIRNELINRSRLSSAAARARRELMEAMVLHQTVEVLGLQGTGPEKAIYLTMLQDEGLHIQVEDGQYRLIPPDRDSNYGPAWSALKERMERAGDESVPVSHLIDRLRHHPFGLREGPIPILLCLFLTVYFDEMALYQDGAFVPRFGLDEMELMTKRPEYFSIRRFAPEKARGELFELYRDILNAQVSSEVIEVKKATLIGVIAPLIQFVKRLRPYVINTRSVSRQAQNVRHTLQQARDPIDLLFQDLPMALDLPSFDDSVAGEQELLETFRARFTEAIVELKQAYPKLIDRIKIIIFEVFGGNSTDIEVLRSQLKDRVQHLLARCNDRELKPFLAALAGFSGTDTDWIASLATIATQRPVDSWRDNDLETFSVRLADLHTRFSNLETLIAKVDKVLPNGSDDREPRMVSLTRADGSAASNILWVDQASLQEAKAMVAQLIEEGQISRPQLQAIFLLLGEHLLSEVKESSEETAHD
jgi:hypothetical protein